VPRPLDHHLHVALPGAQRQLAERQRDVVLAADLEDLVERVEERVLPR
jgi:heme oxygenase